LTKLFRLSLFFRPRSFFSSLEDTLLSGSLCDDSSVRDFAVGDSIFERSDALPLSDGYDDSRTVSGISEESGSVDGVLTLSGLTMVLRAARDIGTLLPLLDFRRRLIDREILLNMLELFP
jgi:hypothetical protein